MKILIIGAGPCGLGAATQLEQLKHTDWSLWEAEDVPGGLSRSFSNQGFTWDFGGHVLFSHYNRFDEMLDQALNPSQWLHHVRESWIRMFDRWIPYPFQYNIHHLPKQDQLRCIRGLVDAIQNADDTPCHNFGELVDRRFGEGMSHLFMRPYNFKVWAWPLEILDVNWIGERVAMPDLGRVAEAIVLKKDDLSWGPNSLFRFPAQGGTGQLWTSVAAKLPLSKVHYGRKLVSLDPVRHIARAQDGTEERYDALISTMPLNLLIKASKLEELEPHLSALRHSATHVFGIALRGQPSEELRRKCWMYFPEQNIPFYRVTHFSLYSPKNVPDSEATWSLMAEVSESMAKPIGPHNLEHEIVQKLPETGLIESINQVLHVWHHRREYGYPTPSLGRDDALSVILPELERLHIYSRGRFGGWKYEVGNQDHSFMQGVEVVDKILFDAHEQTLCSPNFVNSKGSSLRTQLH